MIDIKLSPPREGARGGREQFKWEDLKSHDLKDREHYLGHSVKVGLLERKNKFYKHDWYLKKESPDHTDGSSSHEKLDEQQLTRRYEDEIMKEMLGVKPKRLMLLKSRPTDLKQLAELLDVGTGSKVDEDPKSLHSSKYVSKSSRVAREISRSRDAYRSNSDHSSSYDDAYSSRSPSSDSSRHSSRYSSRYSDKYSKSRYKIGRKRDKSTKRSMRRHGRYTGKLSSRRSRSKSPRRRSRRPSHSRRDRSSRERHGSVYDRKRRHRL